MYHEKEMVGEGWEKIGDLGTVKLQRFPETEIDIGYLVAKG